MKFYKATMLQEKLTQNQITLVMSPQIDMKIKFLPLNSQCPRTDLNKRFLPKPMTTTG